MRKACRYIGMLLLITTTAFGQKSLEKPKPVSGPEMRVGNSLLPPVPPPDLFLKTNLFSLIEPDRSVTLSAEYRVDRRKAFQLELGYIFLGGMPAWETLTRRWGYRIKPEWRLYTPGKPFKRYHFVNYWAVEAIIKGVYDHFFNFVGRDCHSDGCAYRQEMNYQTMRNVVGIGGKVGKETYIDPLSKRVAIDYYIGLGVRYRWKTNTLPKDADGGGHQGFLFGDLDPGILPYISAGIKVGLRVF